MSYQHNFGLVVVERSSFGGNENKIPEARGSKFGRGCLKCNVLLDYRNAT